VASASKTPAGESTAATEAKAIEAESEADTAEAEAAEDTNLETTLANIDNMLLNEPTEEAARVAEETLATAPRKEKEKAEDISEKEDFNFQDILGQELSKAEREELKEYAISCGYIPGALLFGELTRKI
jgi:predicted ATPase with chaperone activity